LYPEPVAEHRIPAPAPQADFTPPPAPVVKKVAMVMRDPGPVEIRDNEDLHFTATPVVISLPERNIEQ
jgi:hypothetical protein